MTDALNIQSMARALDGEVFGNQIRCPGPGHSLADRSLTVVISDTAPDGFVCHSHADQDPLTCKDYVRERCGLGAFEASQPRERDPGPGQTSAEDLGADTDFPAFDGKDFMEVSVIVPQLGELARWDYHDAASRLVKTVFKKPNKKFAQAYRVREGTKIGWQWKKPKGFRDIPYNLDAVLKSKAGDLVIICEGEKDCDALTDHGFTAITWGAASRMPAAGTVPLKDRQVLVIGDHDEPGLNHCAKLAEMLMGLAAQVHTWRPTAPPGIGTKPGYDVADWFEAGGTHDALMAVLDGLPIYKPPKLDPTAVTAGMLVTEMNVADAFVEQYGEHIRHDHTRGKWYVWQGYYWEMNETGLVSHWVREFIQLISETSAKIALKVHKASFARGVMHFISNTPGVAVTSDAWDIDPWLLGTPGGTVDLKTGTMGPGSPDQMITRLVGDTPAQNQVCPKWLEFLAEATDGNDELVEALQLWCGYCLTGVTVEQTLVFLHGPGGTGKGVFVNMVARAMGAYAMASDMETFTSRKFSAHPEELASLQHARMVSASETEEGRAWAEARVKTLTGGDKIRARFMRQNSYEYKPSFKLTFMGNHMPALSNLDDAMKRRFRLIPFSHKPASVDLELEDKLAEEIPGILRWMLNGCLGWYQRGLQWPDAVTVATDSYFEDQDVFGQWLEDECRVELSNPHLLVSSRDLFKSWSDYAGRANEPVGTQRTFAATMRKRGFEKKQIKSISTKGYHGIIVRTAQTGIGSTPDDGLL